VPERTEEGHIVLPNTHNSAILLWNCLCGYSTYIDYSVIQKIIDIIRDKNSEVIFVDNSIFGKLVRQIKKQYPNILVLSYYHDVKAKLAKDWLKAAPIYKKPVYSSMLSNEKLTAEYADVNFVLGDREEKLYQEAYGKKPEAHLSVYMDVRLSENFYQKIPNKRKKLLFFGGYYMPNVHGIDWFIREVYPKLESDADLIVAGREMDKLKEKHYPDGVTVQGFVENIETLYRDADIIISPVFEGGGMKVKVAEAMAFGKMIVGSNESYEGYQEKIPDDYWDEYVFRANTADEFLTKIRAVLSMDDAKHHYNSEIRALYDEGFSEKYAENVISEMINKCMGARG
jgi:polysaccharide biosynthesis protein PslH